MPCQGKTKAHQNSNFKWNGIKLRYDDELFCGLWVMMLMSCLYVYAGVLSAPDYICIECNKVLCLLDGEDSWMGRAGEPRHVS